MLQCRIPKGLFKDVDQSQTPGNEWRKENYWKTQSTISVL